MKDGPEYRNPTTGESVRIARVIRDGPGEDALVCVEGEGSPAEWWLLANFRRDFEPIAPEGGLE